MMRTIKKCFYSFICFFLIFLFCAQTYTQNRKNEPDNTLGKAYAYLANKKFGLSVKSFEKAAELVMDTNDWQAYLNTAQGLIVFKKFDKAKALIQKTVEIVNEQKNERAFVAVGYGIVGLPEEHRGNLSAENIADNAMAIAYKKDNWYSFIEIGRLYNICGNREKSLTALRKSLEIVANRKTIKGCRELKKVFTELGYPEYVKKCEEFECEFREFASDTGGQNVPAPPAGWSPVGETVAGPDMPGVEAGIAVRRSADDQIANKKDWLLRQEELNANQEDWFNCMAYYYRYPSGYDLYDYTYDDAVAWGHYRLSHYRYRNGFYIRVRD